MEVAEKQKLKRFTINQRWWWWQRWWQRWQRCQWHGGGCRATSLWQRKMDVAEKQKLKG